MVVDFGPMRLAPATKDHLLEMMEWFPAEGSCRIWGGLDFRYPFTAETFLADSKWGQVPSYALVNQIENFCGFGQIYLRVGRCHLARLAILPAYRGKGLGSNLIEMLMEEGTRTLGVSQCSLFVHQSNKSAEALYERMGYELAPYPDKNYGLQGSHYMITRAREDHRR